MRNVTEVSATEAVIRKFDGCADARLQQVTTALVKHPHAFVREIEPTDAERFTDIRFLTATGHTCDDKRPEFILLSDTLGVSTLVELINNRKQPGRTETSVLGLFVVEEVPPLADGATIGRQPARASARSSPRPIRSRMTGRSANCST